MTTVEAVLLCSDLSVHVDSIRPIIRVVMRDALERFAISITQARTVFSPEAVQDVINRILNPPPPKPEEPVPEPVAEVASQPESSQTGSQSVPAFVFPETPTPAVVAEPEPVSIPDPETPELSQAPSVGQRSHRLAC